MSELTNKIYHSMTAILNDGETDIPVFASNPSLGPNFAKEDKDKILNLTIIYNQPLLLKFNKTSNDAIPLRHNAPGTWAEKSLNEMLDPNNFSIREIFLTNNSGFIATADFLILPRLDGAVYN